MHVTFLGTSGAIPSAERNTSSVLVRRSGDRFLFDCGEGTQRQMMRFRTGFDVSHVFLSHLHGDHVLGLPGLCQTWDFNERQRPLVVHTPPGTRDDIESLLSVAGTDPSYSVSVRVAQPGTAVLTRDDFEIRAFRTDHRTNSVGYALVEDERKGRFDRERAEALGVPVGPKFSKLHRGEDVELDDGTVVRSDDVVGPARPGRRLVYTGDTRPTDVTVSAARGADLLIHESSFADDNEERATITGHSTAREAATIARRAGVRRLVLTHVSTRYGTATDRLERQAADEFDGEIYLPDDGAELEVPFPDE